MNRTSSPGPHAFAFWLAVGALLLLGVLAAFPWLLVAHDPNAPNFDALLQPPGPVHLMGTDKLGRDILARCLYGTRVNLQIAVFATLPSLVIGAVLGTLAAYRGGWIDAVVSRLTDVVVTFPFMVLVIAIVSILGPGLGNMYIAVGMVGWVFYARLTRAEVRGQMQLDYADAGVTLGFSPARIMFRHLLPNCLPALITYTMTDMSLSMLLGSALGYLGLGAQPPTAEWGNIIADGKGFISTAWWISFFPGVFLIGAGLAFTTIGDALAERARPKL